jgi:hypothetical protein
VSSLYRDTHYLPDAYMPSTTVGYQMEHCGIIDTLKKLKCPPEFASSNDLLVVSATLNKIPLSSCSAQDVMAWRSSLRNLRKSTPKQQMKQKQCLQGLNGAKDMDTVGIEPTTFHSHTIS